MSFQKNNSFINFLFYDGITKADYMSIKQDLYEICRKKLVLYTLVGAAVFFVLLLISFFVDAIASYRIKYLTMFLGCAVSALILSTVGKTNRKIGQAVKYILEILVLSFGIVLGVDTAPDMPAVAFVGIIGMMPFLVYDPVIRSLLLRCVMTIIYLCVAAQFKDLTAVQTDMINLLSFIVLSTLCVAVHNQIQANEIILEKYMESEVEHQTEKVKESLERIDRLSQQAVTALVKAIDAKDKYTNGHSLRVAKYSKMIAEKLGKSEDEQRSIYFIATMHDVGKMGIPDAIINKPARLTDKEYNIIKQHTEIGYNILNEIDEMPNIAVGAYHHHERYDGHGYPLGLAGDDIPEIAKIIAVADSYDAMTSNRSYRSMLPQDIVAKEIAKAKGKQFDPEIADIMLEIIKEDTDYELHE